MTLTPIKLPYNPDPDKPSRCCDICYNSEITGLFRDCQQPLQMYEVDGEIICEHCLATLEGNADFRGHHPGVFD